jgi:membrane-bound lytic murein transglycosylase MltF
VSNFGAMGLMQIRPKTANELGITNPFNPEENIRGGTKYLAQLLERYHGNYPLALAAYNMGPNAMEKYRKEHGKLPSKVEEYVNRVMTGSKLDIHSLVLNINVKDSVDIKTALSNIIKGIAKVADTVNVEQLGYGSITSESIREAVMRETLKLQPYASVG